MSNWWGNPFINNSALQSGLDQQGQNQQHITQHQQIYQGLSGQINTYYGTIKFKDILDIDDKEKELEANIKTYSKYKEEKDLIDNLDPTTREVLRLVKEITTSQDLKDVVKLDKYIREKLFNNKFDDFIKE